MSSEIVSTKQKRRERKRLERSGEYMRVMSESYCGSDKACAALKEVDLVRDLRKQYQVSNRNVGLQKLCIFISLLLYTVFLKT